ncbi:hypothetical protein Pmani_010834 [Petrolisthes manimaculis]|uniref:Uncharacterized protein n=1 Tax=Petrolisthes manimaculis TaxID=1843537 RepID=A0AAE1Q1D1_9EUCA|nr:hypothetical protein Pmani_010834 [Petrolisthes manimaculis]
MITLSDRRQMIITQQASIVDVFHKYPWLMGSDLLVKELQRLIPKAETSDPRVSLCQGIARSRTISLMKGILVWVSSIVAT